jgi:hypothetical protein
MASKVLPGAGWRESMQIRKSRALKNFTFFVQLSVAHR